jgi:HAMP domain-containing protein
MAASIVQGGQTVGVIVIRVEADKFLGNFSVGLPAPYGFYLTNRWGDFLVHADRSQTYGFDRGQRIRVQDSMAPVGQIIEERRKSVVVVQEGGDGSPHAFAFVRMPLGFQEDGRFMVVGLSQPMAVVQSAVVELGSSIIQVLLPLCLVGVLLAAWVSRVVTGPLHAMVRATQAFSEGRSHGVLPVDRQDELGELARSFHDMEQQIGSQMAELNAGPAPCCLLIWTISSPSTTTWATPWATPCSRPRPAPFSVRCARSIPWPGWRAMSSPCCARTSIRNTRHSRSRPSCSRPSSRRWTSMASPTRCVPAWA